MFNWMDRKGPSEGAYLGSITRFRYLKRKGKEDTINLILQKRD